ncbi:MAG: hypothetical protein RLY86_610 [Pseudomonadota bacterium]|jgi:4-diphosphocytidyl-2-C-methyl-D-erythritol kinase
MAQDRSIQPLFAPAKLNLYLHVTGRRADGYHLLDSLVAFADIGDSLTIARAEPGSGLSFTLDGPFAPALAGEPVERNLVVRALRALAAALDRPADLAVTLTKRLPVASGIGGGSSDAAAALRGAAALWGLAADDPRLYRIGASLGADIPVCLGARTRYFAGTGDDLAEAPVLPTLGLLLVNPGVGLETRAVFAARTAPFTAPARLERAPHDAADLARMLAARGNDLAGPAIALCPVIAEVVGAIGATPGCLLARMSGSGATCFGLYPDRAAAATAASILSRAGWWIQAGALSA